MLAELVEHVIGVDPDRDWITAGVVDARTTGVIAKQKFSADAAGYNDAISWAEEFTVAGERAWAVEGTASYGRGLTAALSRASEWVIEFDRPREKGSKDGAPLPATSGQSQDLTASTGAATANSTMPSSPLLSREPEFTSPPATTVTDDAPKARPTARSDAVSSATSHAESGASSSTHQRSKSPLDRHRRLATGRRWFGRPGGMR